MCGFRPTGRLHLGHYFSVIKPGISGCTVLVANYHAPEEKNLEQNIYLLKKFGIENIILQKDVFDARFYFELLNIVSVPELERMPQYKSACSKSQTSQLLTYPILMAHDVEGYEKVYVGEDQESHLQFAKKILNRHSEFYGAKNICPEPVITTVKIKDLRDSSKKMAKSHPEGCLFLDDSPSDIEKKIKRAVTDEQGVVNLQTLYNEFVNEPMPSSNGEAKTILSKKLIEKFNRN